MPTTLSAKKRLRQNIARRGRNRALKSAMRTQIKKVRTALSEGDVAKAEEEYRLAASQLDRAGARSVLHRNTVGRTKSRLQNAIKLAKQNA